MKNTDMFLNPDATIAWPLFANATYPWEALSRITQFIEDVGPLLDSAEYDEVSPQVWVHRSAVIYPNSYIGGPTVIGPETEVRPGAFIRGSALVGKKCVVGNSTELKNCILFDNVQVPHYNYVGDSILGHYAHMGAGSICSNVKSDKSLVVVHGAETIETGLKKFGAILGDHVEIGCNSVLCPGAVLEPYASVYPLSRVRGVVRSWHIFKSPTDIVARTE